MGDFVLTHVCREAVSKLGYRAESQSVHLFEITNTFERQRLKTFLEIIAIFTGRTPENNDGWHGW